MYKTFGQAVDEAIAAHYEKYFPEAEVYAVAITYLPRTDVFHIELSAAHFSQPLHYTIVRK